MQEIQGKIKTQWNNILVEILKEFVNICNQYNIKYFLAAGSAIGAVRHNGIIPWDDDIDVIMPRPEYNKFIKLCKTIDLGDFEILERETTPHYRFSYAKMGHKKSTLVEVETQRDVHGLTMDIFPLDGTSSNEEDAEKLYNEYKKLTTKLHKVETYFSSDYTINLLKHMKIRTIFRHIYYKLAYNRQDILNKLKCLENKYDYADSSYIINYVEYWGFQKGYFPKEWFENYKEFEFEGINVKIPYCYDQYLHKMYGNYMELPPINKRVSHHSVVYLNILERENIF